MSGNNRVQSADEQLAEIIAQALQEEGLILPERVDEVRRKIADGSAKVEDWSHWVDVELAALQARKEVDDGSTN